MTQYTEKPNDSEQSNPLENSVGFRRIVDTVDGLVKDRLLRTGVVPEKTKRILNAIAVQNSLMAQESFSDSYDRQKFLQYLGSYIIELKHLIDDDEFWRVLPTFIPPDQDTLEISRRHLESIDDPDIYPRNMSEADRAIEIAKNREILLTKIEGEEKTKLRTTLLLYYQELVRLSLEGVSSETDTVN